MTRGSGGSSVVDLPGFYYDADKKRYFPKKSPIPGSSSRSSSSAQNSNQAKYGARGVRTKVVKMLHARELCSNSMSPNKRKVNLQEEYQKLRASKPIIWKYQGTQRIADSALEHIFVDIQTPVGLANTRILLTGGLNGDFCCYEVGDVPNNNGMQCMPHLVQPLNIEEQSPERVWRPMGASVQMLSYVSCIKISRKYYHQQYDTDSSVPHALITSLGSEASGGFVYLMNLREPLELSQRLDEICRFKSTVWTADINSDGSRAVIGTNTGAALVHTESGRRSWICRSKSDVLSLQFDYSGSIVLCGFRNGAVVTVDTREKPQDLQHVPQPSLNTSGKVRGNIGICMPSSVSCLAALKLYDESYLLASSMDGTVKLYDYRLTGRGKAVQTYEGNVNSHTRLQLGVDPSERFFMSGGEDFGLRVWSIKSGELLYEDKFMNSVASVVCWAGGGAWLGSQEGLFYVQQHHHHQCWISR